MSKTKNKPGIHLHKTQEMRGLRGNIKYAVRSPAVPKRIAVKGVRLTV